ncbi:MAG TPA: Asp-tRNA(Asn)/Glu-tRNA(Gln) amidotransferase subunit GatC [Firmicutes bacterium]|nr:Asp-tRNA(Asn)/Glu-tRNA(Gln) amidotransferase subunit GatC [Bacillota bacterium]
MMKITEAEVERIAHFAQLEVTPEEIGKLAQQLSDILAFARQLKEVDTEGVTPTVSVLDLINVWREDEVLPWLDQKQALAQAKDVQDGCFRVPRIMEEE